MLIAAHLLAICAVLAADMPHWAGASVSVLLLCNLLDLVFFDVPGRRWRSFALSQRRLTVDMPDGHALGGELLPQTLVIPFCVVLRARLEGRMRSQVIFADAMSEDAFRELRVRLRYP